MLVGAFIFVSAGTQLAQAESLSGILSLNLILSFALLSLLPLIAKTILNIFKVHQVYESYNKTKKFNHNIIIIDAISGGLINSYIAAAIW